MAQALLPLKDLVQAKSRLAGILSPSERRALAQAMVEDVLALLSRHPQISRVTLVSDDPGADLLASHYGARYWPESALGCRGLNAVVDAASRRLLEESAEPVLVLHGDLPLMTVADITAVLGCQSQQAALVIGCDHRGTGTNLLAFDAATQPQFCFGQDSCQRHQATASLAGMPAVVVRRSGIALDVDEPEDLGLLLQAMDSGEAQADVAVHTRRLLSGTGLGARIELALASIGQENLDPNEEQAG